MTLDRMAEFSRETKETKIRLSLNLDGEGKADVFTGIGFFDHMLTTLAVHGGFDLSLDCKGDLDVDCHHTIEDVGICLGKVFADCLSNKENIARYGNYSIPMDEALAQCSVDVGGRAYLVFNTAFSDKAVGGMDTQMVEEFFRAFAANAKITLHLNLLYGQNDHHKCEAIFKSCAHALKEAVAKTGKGILSAKGAIDV